MKLHTSSTMSTPDFLTVAKSPAFIVTCLSIFSAGLFIGYKQAEPATSSKSSRTKKSWPNSYDVQIHRGSSDEEDNSDEDEDEDEDEEDEEGEGKELKDFSNTTDEVKLVLVVRTDLGMSKGYIHVPFPFRSIETPMQKY